MKPRILFLLSALETGGAERQTASLAKQLIAAGFRCDLLSYYNKASRSIVDDDLVSHVRFAEGRNMRNPFEWRIVWSRIAARKPDVVVAVNLSVLPIAGLGKLLGHYDSSVVCTFHTTVLTNAKERLLFPISRAALLNADCLVYVCNAQRTYWQRRRLFARENAVIYNGVDIFRYSPTDDVGLRNFAKAQTGFAPSDFVIGLTASFRPEKNHSQAVDALCALRALGIPAKLLFVGDGETRKDLVQKIETLGLTADIKFVGDQSDVRPFIRAFDVGLLCSTGVETFSMAALETMAMGVPMVMPRMSGCVEMVEGSVAGRIFDVGDTAQLVACLLELTHCSARARAAQEAREVVVEKFTEQMMIDKYTLLFERMNLRRQLRLRDS